MNRKPDDRRDNVEKIQWNIDHTVENIRLSEKMINQTSDEQVKRDLKEKNERRKQALEGMRHEIKDEAKYRESRQQ